MHYILSFNFSNSNYLLFTYSLLSSPNYSTSNCLMYTSSQFNTPSPTFPNKKSLSKVCTSIWFTFTWIVSFYCRTVKFSTCPTINLCSFSTFSLNIAMLLFSLYFITFMNCYLSSSFSTSIYTA